MRAFLRILIVISVPFVLTMGVVRIFTLPWYPAWAYERAAFPADPGGMPEAWRLYLAQRCIAYLNLPRGVISLEELHLLDGSPAFNDREISHMADVKRVYGQLTAFAAVALVMAISAGWVLHRRWPSPEVWRALSDGGLLTVLILSVLGVWMLVGWEVFFTQFHAVFFEGGSWLFRWDDTLIRLFPMAFWQWAGLMVAGIVGGIALLLALAGRIVVRRYRMRSQSSEK
jgi:integral membrane protein (TIGR01906 family)